jgi:hypothetical protein
MIPKWLVRITDHQVRPQTYQAKSNTPLHRSASWALKIKGVKIIFSQRMLLLQATTLQPLMYIIILILATTNNITPEIAAQVTVA